MRTFQEHTKATTDPIRKYRPLPERQPRLNEHLLEVATEAIAEVMPPAQAVVVGEEQTVEYLFRLVVRLDHLISRDAEATEVHKRLSLQNVVLAFLVMRLLAAEIPPEGETT